MFRRAVLVDDAIWPGGVVGHGLEGAGVEGGVEPLAELVHGPVGGLVGDHHLVQLPDGGTADGSAAADFAVDGVSRRHLVLQDGQEVVRILSSAGRWNGGRFETAGDEVTGLDFVQPVDALDDAGLYGPAPVKRRQVSVRDVGPSVEPLLAQVVILGEVAVGLRLQLGDGMPRSGRHGFELFGVAIVGDTARQA